MGQLSVNLSALTLHTAAQRDTQGVDVVVGAVFLSLARASCLRRSFAASSSSALLVLG